MARARQGLGPQGHTAISKASITWAEINQQSRKSNTDAAPISSPPARGLHDEISRELPAEADTLPTDWWTFQSSRMVEAGYDSGSQRLYVRFVKPTPQGTPWTYESVPPNVWRNLRRSQSPGQFVNRVLNGYVNHHGRWG